MSKINKINTKYQAAAGTVRPKPGPSLGTCGLGPGRAGCRLVFCIDLVYLGNFLFIYLGIMWYNFDICLVYFWYMFAFAKNQKSKTTTPKTTFWISSRCWPTHCAGIWKGAGHMTLYNKPSCNS